MDRFSKTSKNRSSNPPISGPSAPLETLLMDAWEMELTGKDILEDLHVEFKRILELNPKREDESLLFTNPRFDRKRAKGRTIYFILNSC